MGYYCTVPQCTSLAGKTKNVKFHRFPRDDVLAKKWNVILKRGKPYTKYSKVCSLHFTQADYNITTMGQWKTLSKDAVPSQNLPKVNPDGTVMVIRKSRVNKYKELVIKKDRETACDTSWPLCSLYRDSEDDALPYRVEGSITPTPADDSKPKKQDAVMQTDPVSSRELYNIDDPNVSSEASQHSYSSENVAQYPSYVKEQLHEPDEDNMTEQFPQSSYVESKPFVNTDEDQFIQYQNYVNDAAELLRNQQHNLQILQQQHRGSETQNLFADENPPIKQELELSNEEDNFIYSGPKSENIENSTFFEAQVKTEPGSNPVCDSGITGESSTFFGQAAVQEAPANIYYTPNDLVRPGPELLIAKQNALAAHTQLWQNTMKRPFFYSEPSHYNALFHSARSEDLARILNQ